MPTTKLKTCAETLTDTIEGSTTFPKSIPGRRSARKRGPLCRNPSDHFWLGLAIRLLKGTDFADQFDVYMRIALVCFISRSSAEDCPFPVHSRVYADVHRWTAPLFL
jgi:hypothetical protein